MDGTFAINKGLRLARSLLLEISELGLPTGCEFLDTITPQYTADLVSWGAIGARTTESQVSVTSRSRIPPDFDPRYPQVHRELVSALSMPTGFKNSTDGTTSIAVDACRAACSPHVFLSVGKEGLSSIVETSGNPDVHVILRGGSSGPNYESEWVEKCSAGLKKAGVVSRVMVRRNLTDLWRVADGMNRLIARMGTPSSSMLARPLWRRILHSSLKELILAQRLWES
jgi:3-deoxy-7-phosphoheptulonate synthase